MNETLYTHRDTCRLCHSSAIECVVGLEPMSIATPTYSVPDSFDAAGVEAARLPLDLYLCRACGHLQIVDIINPSLNYRDYVYRTSVSLGLPEHFRELAGKLVASVGLAPGALVVEMGSNDGTCLRAFKERGFRALGVDPAVGIARDATASGIETLADFFGTAVADAIVAGHGPAGLMIANNVFANIDDLDDIAEGVKRLLAPDGVFVFETQYGLDVIQRDLWDTVYHEHLSYFNIAPLDAFFAARGLQLIEVERIATKGGSIRVKVQRAGGPRPVDPSVGACIAVEAACGAAEPAFYAHSAANVRAIRDRLLAIEAEVRAAGRPFAGYGVSVGTTALMPQFGMTERIDCFYDDDPDKPPRLKGPGYDLPVLPSQRLYDDPPGAILIFAWRYAEPIMARHHAYLNSGGRFIVPLPTVKVHTHA